MGKLVGTLRNKNIQNISTISIQQMEGICSSCAKIMKERGLKEIDAVEALNLTVEEKAAGVGGDYPGAMPRQLSAGLCKKFGGDPGFFTACENSDLRLPEGYDKKAYCAELHKHCVGKWPTEGEHPKRQKKHFIGKFVQRKK